MMETTLDSLWDAVDALPQSAVNLARIERERADLTSLLSAYVAQDKHIFALNQLELLDREIAAFKRGERSGPQERELLYAVRSLAYGLGGRSAVTSLLER